MQMSYLNKIECQPCNIKRSLNAFLIAVKWLKDGKEITEPHATMKKDGISHQMVIANVTAKDEGVYKVIAENEEGNAETSVNVSVTDKR